MPITINGSGTITGLSAGGLPDGTVQPADLSTGAPYWDTSGNVGISTSSPSSTGKLAIQQTVNTPGNAGLSVIGSGTDAYCVLQYQSSISAFRFGPTYGSTGGYLPLAFFTSDAERMRIDPSGNVGIGATPSAGFGRLQVKQPSADRYGAVLFASGNDAFLQLGHTGTVGAVASTYGATAGFTPLTFWTSDTERMRIDTSGNLLVGTTSQQSSGKFCVTFDGTVYNGNVLNDTSSGASIAYSYFLRSGTLKGSITYSSGSNTVSYNTTSDYRLKTDIVDLPNALETINQLKPRQYKWKSNGHMMTGFIAHELQAVVPDAVVGEKDAVDAEGNPIYQGIDTSFLVATLTAAIQELNAKVDAQAAEIAALKGAA